MIYKLKCKDCSATCWVRGSFECPETGAVELNETREYEWEGGHIGCKHMDWDVVDGEADQDDLD